jgi:hypothetical protein
MPEWIPRELKELNEIKTIKDMKEDSNKDVEILKN